MSNRWYCGLDSGVWGPAEVEHVKEILDQGHLHKATWVRREDGEEWVALADAGLFPLDSIPDPPEVTSPEPTASRGSSAATAAHASRAALASLGARGQQVMQAVDLDERKRQARETFNLYRLFWTRVLKSDFSVVKATEDEKRKLASGQDSVESPLAQDYASWRRSLLMICILVLAIATFFNITDIWAILGDRDTHAIRKVQTALLFLFQIGSVVLCLLAAWKWGELRKSRSLARFAWLTQFVGPFLVFLMPLGVFIDEELVLVQLGVAAVVTLAPKIFGLFPGLIRCSLTVKTLLPETGAPGWLGIIIAPLYLLFLAVATIAAVQMSQLMLGIGLGLLAAQMGVVIWQAKRLLAPCGQEEASTSVKAIKRTQLVFQIAGIACIATFLYRVAEFDWVWINSLVLFVFSFIGNVTLLTVVMSDFMLGMIRQGQLQAEAFAGTPLAASLATRLDDLASCGLTDLEAGETAFAGRLKSGGGALARAASSRGSGLLERARGGAADRSRDGTES